MYKSFKDLTPEEFAKVLDSADLDSDTRARLEEARNKVVGSKIKPCIKEVDRIRARSIDPTAEGEAFEELSLKEAVARVERELQDELTYRGFAGGY